MTLDAWFDAAARRDPDRIAVVDPEHGEISYRALAELSDRVHDYLHAAGVVRGDRVGICLPKSIESVAILLGAMKAGAAYVPVDAHAPMARAGLILRDCAVSVVFVAAELAPRLRSELPSDLDCAWLSIEPGDVAGLSRALSDAASEAVETASDDVPSGPSRYSPSRDDVAYILYTSGSTGRPKGVTLTHEAAMSFVDWAVGVVAPTADDRFSSHAPFHIDLSVFDLYACFRVGATLVLVSEAAGKEALGLGALIAAQRITVWYSAPSILSMLAQVGRLAEHDVGALRVVLFAGEVFPIAHLRTLTRLLPDRRYLNLYGPTETNVCTYHEATLPIPDDRTAPLPIGKVCENLEGRVVDEAGAEVVPGEEGELVIAGPNVMRGYFGRADLDARAFLILDGTRFYRTGDLVVQQPDGNLLFHGRRDRMIKRRGYRVELGEIEACLYRHPEVREAAVVAVADGEGALKVRAHLVSKSGKKISGIKLRSFCAAHVPVYMIPDAFSFHEALPKTSTDKTDYQRLKAL